MILNTSFDSRFLRHGANISRELIFTSIEKALRLAITKWQASMVSASKPKKTRKKDKPEVAPVVDAAAVAPPEPDPDEIREEDIGTGCGLFEVRKIGDE